MTCPAFAESITEGDLRWEKAVGDAVSEDEVICEVETDKTSVPVPAPCAGVIEELLVEDGSTVNPGMKLVKIKVGAAPAPAHKCACKCASAPVVEQPAGGDNTGERFKPPKCKIFNFEFYVKNLVKLKGVLRYVA